MAMTKDSFKTWLEQGGATEKASHTRAYAVSTIERNLAALGMPYKDMDEAWQADKFQALRDRLRSMREDAKKGGQDYRLLMPNSENPHNRLPSWSSWLAQYGRFLDGEPPGAAKDADRIRLYVFEHYIEPARDEERDQVEVLVREVNEALGLNEAWPNICQALGGRMFQEMAEVPAPERIGADQSSSTRFRFDLRGRGIRQSALEELRKRFITLCPDFRTFNDPGTGWAHGEKAYKVAAIDRVRSALGEESTDEVLGKNAFEILKTAAKDGPLVRWQTEDAIAKNATDLLLEFYTIIGRLVRSKELPEIALATAQSALEALRERGASSLTYGERINIVSSALAMVRPNAMVPIKITRINGVWEALTGEKLFVEAEADTPRDYHRLANGFEEISKVMRDEWHWEPQDWLDIQGFLWIANSNTVNGPADANRDLDETEFAEKLMSIAPVNLILYGPPGTGKTFTTTAEAVRLCGEPVPDNRAELMAVYQRLVAAGRIEFVTFHQSMSYEDFVEGLRPTTGRSTDPEVPEDEEISSGFRLEPQDGIFKRISERAASDRGEASAYSLDRTRRIYRMGLIGSDWRTELQKAIDDKEITWGWAGETDWSAPEYEDWRAIKQRRMVDDPSVKGNHATVYGTWLVRAGAPDGAYIILTVGRNTVVAFGRFAGDYKFTPSSNGGGARHTRPVEWIWTDPAGIDRSAFYATPFTSFHPIYPLDRDLIEWTALESLVLGAEAQPANPRPYVLIIDEINRANISKVFGELITLLEPDKRLGAENQIKVTLPYSKKPFGVPHNLHIVGTMNTADRSIALLDTALRRRFTFRELMPDPDVLQSDIDGIDMRKLLRTINERIEYLFDREHQIGHAYFSACRSRTDVDDVMRHKVIPLLAEYFYEDWAKIAAVLGDLDASESSINGGFLKRSVLKPAPGLENGDLSPRFRWEVRSQMEGFDYRKLLGA